MTWTERYHSITNDRHLYMYVPSHSQTNTHSFCTIMAVPRQKEARSRKYALVLSNDFKGSS